MGDYSSMNLHQKLAEIRKMCNVIQKNKSGYGYKYVTEDEILSRVTLGMNKYGVSLFPTINQGTPVLREYTYEKTKFNKTGGAYLERNNELIVTAEMTYTWINNDNPDERLVVPWYMAGQQTDASQAFGAGLTYANRYFLLKFFSIATVEDDPDNFRSKQKQVEQEQDAAIAANIIAEVDAIVKAYVAAHPDKRDDVVKTIKSTAKVTNYNNIRDTKTAKKLLDAVQKYNEEE